MAKANEETILAVKLAELFWRGHLKHGHNGVPEGKSPLTVADDAATLKSMARSLHRLMEAACNGYRNESDEAHAEKRITRLSEAVVKLAAEYGIVKVTFNGDPRGYAVKLHFPDGRGNTLGGDEEGWGI